MTTGLLMIGKNDSTVMVCVPLGAMLKVIVFVCPGAALELRIAWRNEPGPVSAVVVTMNVDGNVRSSRRSHRGVNLLSLRRTRAFRDGFRFQSMTMVLS